MKDTLVKSLIRALENLQSLRGCLSTIIVDETKFHKVLKRESNCPLTDLLFGTKTPLLAKASVSILITPGEHHEAVARLETIIKKIKKVINLCMVVLTSQMYGIFPTKCHYFLYILTNGQFSIPTLR